MGQIIEFNSDDWDFQDEDVLEFIESKIVLPDEFYMGTIKTAKIASSETTSPHHIEVKSGLQNEPEVIAFLNGEKIQINAQDSERLHLTQEEEAFRRQIEDLFELLELEKASTKSNGIRVYQTDSSPSRPWRFH